MLVKEKLYILSEKRVFFLQNKLCTSLYLNNIKNFFLLQKLFIKSFSVRLYVVKNILEDLCSSFVCSLPLDLYDKVNLAINLNDYLCFSRPNIVSKYFLRKRGISYDLLSTFLYEIIIDFLFSVSILSMLEVGSDRFTCKFRFSIPSNDLCFYLESSLARRKFVKLFSFAEIDLESFFLSFPSSDFSVLKIFPLEKNLILHWFRFYSSFPFCVFYSYLTCSFFDFLFLGLV